MNERKPIRGIVCRKLDHCGFIRSSEKEFPEDCFFHESVVSGISFADLHEGDVVEFTRTYVGLSPNRHCPYQAMQVELVVRPIIGAYSLRGGNHDFNEDEFCVKELVLGRRIIAAVADGVSNPVDTGWWASSETMTCMVQELKMSPLATDVSPIKPQSNDRRTQLRTLIDRVQARFKKRQLEMTDNRRQG